MSDVSHGVNASKTNNGAITPVSVDTGVHFVVGTAPVQMVNGKVNEVIMASSYKEAVQALLSCQHRRDGLFLLYQPYVQVGCKDTYFDVLELH